MLKLFQINITANWGSHGKIAEDIGKCAMVQGWDSYIAYGRWSRSSKSKLIRIGNLWDERWHALQNRIIDNHGLASKAVTHELVNKIIEISPDVIHLHNIHGYYLNYPILFGFLAQYNKPVVWTLHDCWSFTGHCAYFTYSKCEKWKTCCHDCSNKKKYPSSYFLDKSKRNYELKRDIFTSVTNMTLIPVSEWLDGLLAQSFLKNVPRRCIHNGIDLDVFKPNEVFKNLYFNKKIVLGVSSIWETRKGLADFISLREILDNQYVIILIGLTKRQIAELPRGIIGIERTNDIHELTAYYSRADVFVNPTYEDNFPTTNLEALACGVPVITYNTGGSPEAIDEQTGIVTPVGDIRILANSIIRICSDGKNNVRLNLCRQRAELFFNKNDCYKEYLDLYHKLLQSK